MTDRPVGLLLFRLAGRRAAIDLGMVTEVSELPTCWPIPLAPPWFAGVINFHGALVPLLDLAMYRGTGRGIPQGKVLVLDRQLCDLALWVDGVERITGEFFPSTEFTPDEPFVQGFLTMHGEEIPLLDATGLLEALETELKGISRPSLSAGPA